MKLTINCIENGGFTGRYDLPGFGCVLLVNAEDNVVTIEVIDEEQDRINTEIEEERQEKDLEDEEIAFVYNEDPYDDFDIEVEDTYDEEDEDELCENEDSDIEDTFEYKFIKSIQETDESGTVLKFLETLLDEYNMQEMTEGDMPALHKLLVGISDYVNQNDEDKV